MGVKMNLRIITKNHAADQESAFLTKSIRKAYGRAAAMPTPWGLINPLNRLMIQKNLKTYILLLTMMRKECDLTAISLHMLL